MPTGLEPGFVVEDNESSSHSMMLGWSSGLYSVRAAAGVASPGECAVEVGVFVQSRDANFFSLAMVVGTTGHESDRRIGRRPSSGDIKTVERKSWLTILRAHVKSSRQGYGPHHRLDEIRIFYRSQTIGWL
jgi:hypothetical protein